MQVKSAHSDNEAQGEDDASDEEVEMLTAGDRRAQLLKMLEKQGNQKQIFAFEEEDAPLVEKKKRGRPANKEEDMELDDDEPEY